MSSESPPVPDPTGLRSPALFYVGLCGAGLVLLLLVMMSQKQSGTAGLLILLVGLLGVLTRLSLAPLLLFLVVVVSQAMQHMTWIDFRWRWQEPQTGTFAIADVMLATAVLAYAIGHYRLQGVSRHIFPPDPRLRLLRHFAQRADGASAPPAIERQRATRLVSPMELAVVVLMLPLWALWAELGWYFLAKTPDVLARQHHAPEWGAGVVRVIALATMVVAGLLLAGAVLRYVGRWRMTVAEARLMMLDTLWNETRGEQRWFTRWQAWWAVKRQERKEKP